MSFKHFPKETAKFYEDIVRNNNKEWFEENRERYNEFVLTPARSFVNTIGERLAELVPTINYIPKINGSIYKIFRDARYHKGAPLKTHLGVFFWEGIGRSTSCGFYFQISPPFYTCGVGTPCFEKPLLDEYRAALLDDKKYAEFESIMKDMKSHYYELRGDKKKRLPRGVKAEGDRAEYLLYNSLYISDETPINEDFYSDEFADHVFEIFKNMLPYHNWLNNLIIQSKAKQQ